MIKKIMNHFKQLEQTTYKIMKYGLYFCFGICLLAVFILLTYEFSFPSPFIFYIGINLFKISLLFGMEFIVCAFVVDGIKKQFI